MANLLKQSSTAQPLLFQLIDSSDHLSGKTGVTPTVTLSKNGGSFASPAGTVTEISAGWYKVAGNVTDTGTMGPLIVHATGTGCDPVDVMYEVVAFDPQDSTRLGLTALPNAAAEAAGGLYTRGTGAGQINQPGNGKIDANTITFKGNSTLDAGDFTNAFYTTGIANAVWDATTAAHVTASTFGLMLGKVGAPAGATIAADIAGVLSRLGTPTGASVSADVAGIITNVSSVLAKTNHLPSVDMLYDADGRAIVDPFKMHFVYDPNTGIATFYRADNTTPAYTKTLTTNPAALPIVGN
jgi:hypothetical protein